MLSIGVVYSINIRCLIQPYQPWYSEFEVIYFKKGLQLLLILSVCYSGYETESTATICEEMEGWEAKWLYI